MFLNNNDSSEVNMKKIGLVGGTGPESTLMYYKELNSRIDYLTGGKEMPDIAIESVNFRKAWDYVSGGKYRELSSYLSEKVNLLKQSGCEIITLTAGTMHIVFDEIEKNTNVSLVSIPKAVCDEAVRRGYRKVGLLGTMFTMEQDYMKKDLMKLILRTTIISENGLSGSQRMKANRFGVLFGERKLFLSTIWIKSLST